MSGVTHQTAELSAGRHRSPKHGVCVMELASMLAEEPFTDRPACVDPVIGAFLRHYNDAAAPGRRRDLYPYAAAVVGTATSRHATRVRARICRVRARHVRGRGHRSPLGWVLRTWAGIRAAERLGEAMALRADPAEHARALELLDLLIAIERPSRLLPDAVGAQPRPAPTPERSAIAAS